MEDELSETDVKLSESDIIRTHSRNPILALYFPEQRDQKTLIQLCIQTLVQTYGPDPLAYVANDPKLLQIHYETLDINMPLANCYHIKDDRFWIRVVLGKHRDKSLAVRQNVKWKSLGISLKFVEIIENETVEYFAEAEVVDLAKKIQEFVKELEIKHLQSLRDRSFEKYFHESSSSEDDEEDILNEEQEEEDSESSVPTSIEEDVDSATLIPDEEKTQSQLDLERRQALQKADRKRMRQVLREDKKNARIERLARIERRRARRLKRGLQSQEVTKKKRKKRNYKTFFGIPLSEEDEDPEKYILDKRNLELYFNHKRSYNYPAKDCHHIDLRFLQHFKNLNTLVLMFLGPILGRDFYPRHLKFSTEDIKKLTQGIEQLPVLQVFRLRNSLMDADKLLILVRGLKNMHCLEVLDLGFDGLGDDCSSSFFELFEGSTNIKHLELESNKFGGEVLRTLGDSLKNFDTGTLDYLGLARNPVRDNALHALVSRIRGTKHLSSLSLRGIGGLTLKAWRCCIIDELLGQHSVLRKLDLTAVPIKPDIVDYLVNAINSNKNIMEFHCLACGLDEQSERDINLILKRNHYIAANPYVDDQTKTDEEIDEWHNQTRNPILLKVYAERKDLQVCPTSIFKDFFPTPTPVSTPDEPSIHSDLSIDVEENEDEAEAEVVPKAAKRKVQLFIEHPYVDPEENNEYLKNFKEKYDMWSKLKNVALV